MKKKLIIGMGIFILAACDNATEVTEPVEDLETEVSVEEEPGLDALDQSALNELEKLGDENQEINWDKVNLNKKQFKEFLKEFSDELSKASEDKLRLISAKMVNDTTIEFVISNPDQSVMSEVTNGFFAIILDTFTRQLYLNSDYSTGAKQPTIIVKDDLDTIISEADDFIELEEEGPVAEEASETVVEETEPVNEKESQVVEKEADDVPREYQSALNSAKSYANGMDMSKAGIYNQLISEYGEKFPEEAAQYAMDNLTDVDWNNNALRSAESYSNMMHMSKQGIYDQLTSEYGEQFTAEEAQYAIDNLTADYQKNALETARSYQDTMDMSLEAIRDQLISDYGEQFTIEEAEYAINNLN